MEFRILGPVEAYRDGDPLPVGGGRQRALLALLLLHANETVSRDRLVADLWGEQPPPTAAKIIQGLVSGLRRVLDPDVLITRGSGYELRLDEAKLDRAQFERLCGSARAAREAGRAQDAATLLREALDLWAGPPLYDVAYESFAQAEIARLEELHAVAVEDRIDADLACGRHAEIVGELEALIAEHPLRERLQGQLMLALYRSGRQAEALAVYRDAREALVETLGLDPGRELQYLEAAILRQDPALDLVAEAPATPAPAGFPSLLARAAERPFVSRTAELDRLRDAVRSPSGRVIAVAGEPGIGKTTIVAHVARAAYEEGTAVLLGRCHPEALVPYEPFVELLRGLPRPRLDEHAVMLARLLPELGDAGDATEDDAAARHLLFDAVGRTLAAAAPVVAVIDDLHWAEPATLLLLRHVARAAERAQVLLVVTYRTTEARGTEQVLRSLTDLERELDVERIRLAGLRDDEVAALVGELAGMAPAATLSAALSQDTAGNPLFVVQLLRHLADTGALVERSGRLGLADGAHGVPETAKELVAARLDTLDEVTPDVLRTGAAIGRTFDGALLTAIEGTKAVDALDAGVAAGLLEVLGDGQWGFVHAIVRDAVYETTGGGRRARLHRRIAETLGDDADPAELARHFLAAGDRAEGLRCSLASAERALGQLAFEDAAAHFLNALGALGETDSPQRCELFLALGAAHARAGDIEAARAAYRNAIALAEALGLPRQLALATIGYGGRVMWDVSRDDPELVRLLERALSVLGDTDDRLRARLLARLGGGPLRMQRDHEQREALTAEAVALARRLDDPGTLAYALSGYIAAHHSPEYTTRQIEDSGELIAVGMRANDLERVIEGHEHRAFLRIQLGDMEAADADIAAIERATAALRQPAQDWMLAYLRAQRALFRGELEEAEDLMEAGVRAVRSAQLPFSTRVTHGMHLLVLRRFQGRLSEVEPIIQALDEDYGATYDLCRCAHLLVLAELDRRDKANDLLEALAVDAFAAVHRDETWMGAIALVAEATAILGNAHHAATVYAQISPYADRIVNSTPDLILGSVGRCLGLLASTCGRDEQARRHFDAAVAHNERVGARAWHALSLYDRAALDGDAERYAQAAAAFAALGMDAWATKCSST